MPQFPHLPLPKKINAPYKFKGLPIKKEVAAQTQSNLANRTGHGRLLKRNARQLQVDWSTEIESRSESGLPDLPQPDTIPVFLQLDTSLFDAESLKSFGIEVVAEDEDGYVIGASIDKFKSLRDKIDKFVQQKGKYKDKAAQLWSIITGTQWRIDYILSEELRLKWESISDTDELLVDVSIACYLHVPKPPTIKKDEAKQRFKERYDKWQRRKIDLAEERLELEEQRQAEFDQYIAQLEGERITDFVGYDDSFACRLRLKGLALKDLVLNYQYLFDVAEFDDLTYMHPETRLETLVDADFSAPDADSPAICVIDSGIQENHRMITDAVDTAFSKSYLPGNTSVNDETANGGHGTKVAGAVLFANDIPDTGNHQHPFWIQNARILNANKNLPFEMYPPVLMKQIQADFDGTRIFNLSVNSFKPCRIVHMSEWATTIDQLSQEKDILFIISAGNVNADNGAPNNPGIKQHLAARRNYPDYLLEHSSRIANPSQSCFALTVGAVSPGKFEDADRASFAEMHEVSSLTRTGPGLWRMIKPDVVEYGGDFVREKNANPNFSTDPVSSARVIRSTYTATNAIGHDIGTSFAAPKVAHIAGTILKIIPNASANLIRALVAQGARMPETIFRNPSIGNLRMYGYGVASKLRSTENTMQRITLTAEGIISPKQAEIYTLKIPDIMRGIGDEYDILIEVTLAFMARPRRTRRRMSSYLSSWVDWQSSKLDESYNQFKSRVTKLAEGEEAEEENDDAQTIQWCIRENLGWGTVKGMRRQDSSLQKDWTILKPYQMPEEFSVAVVGHTGWDRDVLMKIPYSIAVSFEVLNAEIDVYEGIRLENEIEIEQEIDTDL